MPLLIAPYNNAMRLGQGFNSYTQQICIDDAVVVDPNRAENVVTNDGTTMRIMSQSALKPSAWNRQREIVNDTRAEKPLALVIQKENSSTEITSTEKPGMIDISQRGSNEQTAEKVLPTPVPSSKDNTATEMTKTKSDSEYDAAVNVPSNREDSVAELSPVRIAERLAKNSDTLTEKALEDTTSEPLSSNPDARGDESISNNSLEAIEHADAVATTVDASSLSTTANPEVQIKPYEIPQQPSQTSAEAREGLMQKTITTATGQDIYKPMAETSDSTPPATEVVEPKFGSQELSTNKEKVPQDTPPTVAPGSSEQDDELVLAELKLLEKEEKERIAAERKYRTEIEREAREDERERRRNEREEAKEIRQEKREAEKQRREDNRKAIKDAVESKAEGASLEDLKQIAARNQYADRFSGMATDDEHKYTFDPTTARGPSQSVNYSSKFVERLSDITDDMCLSGALSIKAAKIGGSGRGSFVDSDKFKESDLNFYISVKVTNQTVNFKDALVFNPLRSVNEDNFNKVYGDSFISGFMEGGEFNAVVSMKVLNKAKMSDIRAEAKVALTAGPVDITAEANVGIARSNLETNTETTIQVSWCGGGHIKPLEQQWNIKSLMQAAARFPDLVADCPQRTYAILTKYETLRSFLTLKTSSFTPLEYENAQIYTNALMDSFMTYKSMYKAIGEDIFNIDKGLLDIEPWSNTSENQLLPQLPVSKAGRPIASFVPDRTRFPPTIEGLNDARTAIRKQMTRIVNEVDAITNDPPLASADGHDEPFQSPISFKLRLPRTKIPDHLRQITDPLTGKRMMAPTQTEAELAAELERKSKSEPLEAPGNNLSEDERSTFEIVLKENPSYSGHFKVSSAIGSIKAGEFFNNLDFLRPKWQVKSIDVGVSGGAVTYVEVAYRNGVRLQQGQWLGSSSLRRLASFEPGERVTSGSIECGVGVDETEQRVLSIRLFTNRGRRLLGEASVSRYIVIGKVRNADKDGEVYREIKSINIDAALTNGTFQGFFGRVGEANSHIYRLGIIWGLSNADEGRSAPDPTVPGLQNLDDESNSPEEMLSQTQAELAEKRLSLAQSQDTVSSLASQLNATENKLKKMQSTLQDSASKLKKLEELRDAGKPVTFAQTNRFQTAWKMEANDTKAAEVEYIEFSPAYDGPPQMISGIVRLDLKCQLPISLSAGHRNVSHKGFDAFMKTGSPAFSPALSWLALPENDICFQTGIFDTSELIRTDHNQMVSSTITFPRQYTNGRAPMVIAWFCELNIGMDYVRALQCEALMPTDKNFNLRVNTWDFRGDKFLSACVGWLAFDQSANSANRVEAGVIEVGRSEPGYQKLKYGGAQFETPFLKEPKVFIALNLIEIRDNNHMRVTAATTSVTKEGFNYEAGTWADTNMDRAKWIWVAVG